MTNPLLTPFSLPPFSAIRPEDIVPAVQSALADCRAAVERVVAQPGPFTGTICVSRWRSRTIACRASGRRSGT